MQSHLELNQSIPLINISPYHLCTPNPGGAWFVDRERPSFAGGPGGHNHICRVVYKYRPGAGTQTALALLAGGATGNLIDRIWHGQVIDFIDFSFWPVFNLADCAIVVGAVWLCWIFAGSEPDRGVNSWK